MNSLHVTRRVMVVLISALAVSIPTVAMAGSGDDGTVDYGNSEVDEGEDDADSTPTGDGSAVTPPCDTTATYDVCFGDVACWVRDPALTQDPDLATGTRPSEDALIAYRQCQDGSLEWYWNTEGEEGPSLEDRIRSARGAISVPDFSATFNPPLRTLVNLETWWWADGVPQGEIVGTEALGLRAVATRRSMTVDPGDGSAAITCPIATSRTDTCSYTYRRASGSSSYDASITVVYDLRFEEDGQVIDVPAGLPADLVTLQREESVAVPVREIQSTVTRVG